MVSVMLLPFTFVSLSDLSASFLASFAFFSAVEPSSLEGFLPPSEVSPLLAGNIKIITLDLRIIF